MSRHPASLLALLLVFGLGSQHSAATIPTQVESPAVQWIDHVGEALDGSPIPGEIGRLQLPIRHDDPDGDTLEVAFVRFRTTHPDPGPPVFFLAGGPGGSGITGSAVVATHPQIRLLEHSDVIGVDQRGTGLSRPNLTDQEIQETLPLDRAITRDDLVTALRRATAETIDHWQQSGVDLGAFNSVESAHDLDAVRRALGLEEIVLFGTSYGSHLGLAYLRTYDQHVARAVLTKVEGPDHTWKLPSTVQHHLEHLDALVTEHPSAGALLPDLLGTVADLKRTLEAEPMLVPAVPASPEQKAEPAVVVGPLDLQVQVAQALDSARSLAAIPASLLRLQQGDGSDLAATARANRQVGVHAMALMMDCASGATAGRHRRIERETQDPQNLLGDAIFTPFYPEACKAIAPEILDDLGDGFRGPIDSEVPVLFVSGTLDVRTPPSNVEEILDGFPKGIHVVVENAGHSARELMSPEYRDLLQAFLRGEAVDSCRILLPRPMFEGLGNEQASEDPSL